MWSWKHAVSVAFVYVTVGAVLLDIKNFINPKHKSPEMPLICPDPLGDGSIICHFEDDNKLKSHFNVTRIKPSGKWTSKKLQKLTNVGIHKYNMPEYMPSKLFRKLEELHITHSSLKYLNRISFRFMKKLQILNLDYNEIESLPTDVFNDLRSLVFLKLNGNKIKGLQAPLLDHLNKLHTFSAVNNKITEIDLNFFKFNYKIKWIYLYGNKIQKLEIDFRTLKHLKAVDLRGNLGKCNFLYNRNFKRNSTIEYFQKNITKFCDF